MRQEIHGGSGGAAHEGEVLAVGRPFGAEIGVQARMHPGDAVGAQVEHADQAVVRAGADEGEPGAIGRPDECAVVAAIMQQLGGGAAIQRRGPDLAAGEEGQLRTCRGRRGRMAGADFPRWAALQADIPDFLRRRAGSKACGVDGRAAFQAAAARVE